MELPKNHCEELAPTKRKKKKALFPLHVNLLCIHTRDFLPRYQSRMRRSVRLRRKTRRPKPAQEDASFPQPMEVKSECAKSENTSREQAEVTDQPAAECCVPTSIDNVYSWERKILEKYKASPPKDAYFQVANYQTSLERMKKWLRVASEAGSEEAKVVEASVMYGEEQLESKYEYRGDEAAYIVQQAKGEYKYEVHRTLKKPLSSMCIAMDPKRYRARRCLIRLLLSGTLEKNRSDSALRRSFLGSSIREDHLLRVIAGFVVGEGEVVVDEEEISRSNAAERTYAKSLLETSRILFTDLSSFRMMHVDNRDGEPTALLPLLFPLATSLEELRLYLHYDRFGNHPESSLDLSYLKDVVPRLERLSISTYRIPISLSSVSDCDWSSLKHLSLDFSFVETDLSALSDWRGLKLVSLEVCDSCVILPTTQPSFLDVVFARRWAEDRSFNDLSSLSGCDFSALERVSFRKCRITDLSPLCDWKGFAPKKLCFHTCPIKEIPSCLADRCDFSKLRRLSLCLTHLVDISPLKEWKDLCLEELDISYSKKISDISVLEYISCKSADIVNTLAAGLVPTGRGFKDDMYHGTEMRWGQSNRY